MTLPLFMLIMFLVMAGCIYFISLIDQEQKDERLVAVIQIPQMVNVRCYENNHGERRLDINHNNYVGYAYLLHPLYLDMLAWQKGSNPLNFPSYNNIRYGNGDIIHNFLGEPYGI